MILRRIKGKLEGIFRGMKVGALKPIASLAAPLVSWMAKTGAGTNACLRRGCLPMPVHFYSPVPDIEDLKKREVWDHVSEMPGVDFHVDKQLHLLNKMASRYGDECKWPEKLQEPTPTFYSHNSGFSFGCAASTHCMIRYFQSQRVIEIGSGFSSRVISAALKKNQEEFKKECSYTIIDPYPSDNLKLLGSKQLIQKQVQEVELGSFQQLEQNDILFIDSSHVSKIGSDVNYLILDILPRLKPGVIVHIHDIPLPYEYTKAYALNPAFRMFWTESYLLQAFLCFNTQYEILMPMNYLMLNRTKDFEKAFPYFTSLKFKGISHSFWIQRTLSK